jgi:putative transposase
LGTEKASKSGVWHIAQGIGDDTETALRIQRSWGGGGDALRRPYPHVPVDTSEIFGSNDLGVFEGQEAMIMFEKYSRLKKNFKGHSFWARGYYVSTVGLDEAKIRKYIQNQEINEEVEDKYDSDLSDPF